MIETNEKLISAATAAKAMGVSECTVRRWVRTGAIPGMRLGKKTIRLRMSDVEKFATVKAG
jgi:excisionase family DNA binding protein